jgi:endoglucanase
MDDGRRQFLRRLLDAPGPSGFEQGPGHVWRTEAEAFADEVTLDIVGNSYARVRGTAGPEAPTVLVAGHVDEIGFVVTHVDEEGFLWFDALGGWDPQVVVGQRIRLLGHAGETIGVVGKKAIHLMKPEDRDKPSRLSDLWIDIGATDREDARRRVEVGDAGVIDAAFVELSGDICASRSMDDRVGAFVALEAARLCAEQRPFADIVAVANVQEESGLIGAAVAAFRVAPSVAIAVDVTHSTDYPGADKHRDGEVPLGGGPVLTRGATLNPVVYDQIRAAAQSHAIPYTLQATGNRSGTDADSMISSGAGTATGLVSIPTRYMHSPNETVHLGDLTNAARLIAAFVSEITAASDFRPR